MRLRYTLALIVILLAATVAAPTYVFHAYGGFGLERSLEIGVYTAGVAIIGLALLIGGNLLGVVE